MRKGPSSHFHRPHIGLSVTSRLLRLVVAASLLGGVAAADASAATGDLTQKPGTAGCISAGGTAPGGACAAGTALAGPYSVTVSPDGTSAYVVGFSNSVAVFDRAADGTLTQKPGAAGCISETGRSDPADSMTDGQCVDGRALAAPTSVTVSPDGTSVYVASRNSDAVAVFNRAADGTLTQKVGTAGCIQTLGLGDPPPGQCLEGRGLDGAAGVTVSPDGASVYVASSDSFAVAIFDRATDGTLTQKAASAGCVQTVGGGGGPCLEVEGGKGLEHARSVTVSLDGTSVYVASYTPGGGAVAVFNRGADGTLTQKPGTAGCIALNGNYGPCAVGRALYGVSSVAVSPDGAGVYVSLNGNLDGHGGVAVFDRAVDGTLTQKSGPAGCISDTGRSNPDDSTTDGQCAAGRGIGPALSVAVSPDGLSAYLTSQGNGGLEIFDRAVDGTLTQRPGTAGCFSEFGSGGACTDGTAVGGASSVTVSPDSRNVYTTAYGVAVFDRETVDTTPPETSITSGPAQGSTTSTSTPTFAFSSSEAGSTFECRVDAQAFVPCSSPHTTATLAAGQHTFEVRAIDAAGNVDATPASRAFTVATPLVPIAAIRGLRLSPTTFRAAVRPGSAVTYTLNVAALVRFTVQRSSRGRRVGGSCVKQTASNRRRPSCTRYVRVPGSFSRNRPAGADRFRFTARVAGRTLKPGRYRLVATPTANGKTGRPANTRFSIVR